MIGGGDIHAESWQAEKMLLRGDVSPEASRQSAQLVQRP